MIQADLIIEGAAEPKTLSPEKRDKVKDSRVEFKIG